MPKALLREKASISRNIMFKIADNEYVARDVLVRICMALGFGMDNMAEIES